MPVAQNGQVVCDVVDVYVPWVHAMHEVVPAAMLKEPDGHWIHREAALALSAKVPCGHCVHRVSPVAFAYNPVKQLVHVEASLVLL